MLNGRLSAVLLKIPVCCAVNYQMRCRRLSNAMQTIIKCNADDYQMQRKRLSSASHFSAKSKENGLHLQAVLCLFVSLFYVVCLPVEHQQAHHFTLQRYAFPMKPPNISPTFLLQAPIFSPVVTHGAADVDREINWNLCFMFNTTSFTFCEYHCLVLFSRL